MTVVNPRTNTDTRSWYKIAPLSGYSLIRVKQKLHRRRRRVHDNFLSRRRTQKLFTQTIHWNLANPVKNYHGIIGIPHLKDQKPTDSQNELYEEKKRRNVGRIIAVWVGRKAMVRFHETLLRSSKCPRSPGRRENSVWTKIWRIIQRTNYSIRRTSGVSPKLRERQSENPSIRKESLTRNFYWLCFYRGRFLRRIGKVGRIRNIAQTTECKRSPDIPEKRWIHHSCRWFSKN